MTQEAKDKLKEKILMRLDDLMQEIVDDCNVDFYDKLPIDVKCVYELLYSTYDDTKGYL